jgi:hypothetical protein
MTMNALTKTDIYINSGIENRKQDQNFKNDVGTMQKIEEQLIKIKRLNNDIITTSIHFGEHREYAKKDSSSSLRLNTSFLTKKVAFLSQKLAEEIKTLGNLLISRDG